ncbi:MAG: hypothetical protein R3F62_31205 [Planctomycetota bacterium]
MSEPGGFWRNLFDNDYRQRIDIDDLGSRLSSERKRSVRQRRKVAGLEQRVEELEGQVGELALICRGLLSYLRQAELIVPEELEQIFEAIDAEDGVLDGRVTPESHLPKQPVVAPKGRKKRPR